MKQLKEIRIKPIKPRFIIGRNINKTEPKRKIAGIKDVIKPVTPKPLTIDDIHYLWKNS